MIWTDENAAFAARARSEGVPRAEIAEALGIGDKALGAKLYRMGVRRTSSKWTEERIDVLKKMWPEGYSASQISEALNCGLSRCAVIGKAMRLGLAKKERIARPREHHPRKARVFQVPRESRAPTRRERIKKIAELPLFDFVAMPELIDIPVEQRKTLIQLNEVTCRWPVGDPGSGNFYFCGGDAVKGRPYCACHCAVAYRTPEAA